MPTDYARDKNAQYSKDCHYLARKELYPLIFPECELTYQYVEEMSEDKKRFYDSDLSVDTILSVMSPHIDKQRQPIVLWLQERFRPSRYKSFHQVTITEWNPATNQSSEFYKMKAQLVLYAYADGDFAPQYSTPTRFYEVILLSTIQVLYEALTGIGILSLADVPNQRTHQPFRIIPIQPYAKHRVFYRNFEENWQFPKGLKHA